MDAAVADRGIGKLVCVKYIGRFKTRCIQIVFRLIRTKVAYWCHAALSIWVGKAAGLPSRFNKWMHLSMVVYAS